MNSPTPPVVRYVIICEDVKFDPVRQTTSIINIGTDIRPLPEELDENGSGTLILAKVCIFVQLTECRGPGDVQVKITQADTGALVDETETVEHQLSCDPLEVVGLVFRLEDCEFPEPGLYLVQFILDGVVLAEQPLNWR